MGVARRTHTIHAPAPGFHILALDRPTAGWPVRPRWPRRPRGFCGLAASMAILCESRRFDDRSRWRFLLVSLFFRRFSPSKELLIFEVTRGCDATCRRKPSYGPSWMSRLRGSFLFLYFSKTFFTEIYFRFHNLRFLYPYRPAGGRQAPPPRKIIAVGH